MRTTIPVLLHFLFLILTEGDAYFEQYPNTFYERVYQRWQELEKQPFLKGRIDQVMVD